MRIGQVSELLNSSKRDQYVVEKGSGAILMERGILMQTDNFKQLPKYYSWSGF